MDGVFKEEFIEKLEFFIEKTYNRSRICTVVRNVAPECMLLSGGKVYDSVNKTAVEVDGTQGLIDIMVSGRQVDIYLKGEKSDADGYLTWDVEHWSSIDKQRFIRCYSYKGKVLTESTGHNIYDLQNDFKPEEAEKIELS